MWCHVTLNFSHIPVMFDGHFLWSKLTCTPSMSLLPSVCIPFLAGAWSLFSLVEVS